jgi:hypothetical protein
MSRQRDDVLRLTELLRSGEDALWVRLRELLEDRGVSPSTSVLATSFPDDVNFECGVVVTHNRRVYQFGLSCLPPPVEQLVFTEWFDLTERHLASPYHGDVAAAFALLEELGGLIA